MSRTPWPDVSLGDHVDLLSGFAFKSKQFTDAPKAIPLVKGENVHQGYIDWKIAKRWPLKELNGCERYFLEPDDVVLAMDRPWIEAGLKWAWIRPEHPKALLVQRVSRMRGLDDLDTRFLRYIIGSSRFTDYIKPIVTGVNVPHISGSQIKAFTFRLPPIPTQRKIASILSAYDDLIENNSRRIAILQEMAQAIYREWFVNFRFPGHENVKLVPSTLGLIPEGWETMTLKKACELIVDSEHKTAPTQEEGFPSIRTPNIGRGHLLLEGVRRVSVVTYTQWTLRAKPVEGDLILAREAPVGNVAIVPSNEQVCLGQRTVLMRADRSKVHPHYLLRVLLSDYCQNRFSGASSGATVAHLNLKDLRGFEIAFAPKNVQNAAGFENFDRQIANLFKRNHNLRTTRDLLLPKLISGQLDVEELDIDLGLTADELQETTV